MTDTPTPPPSSSAGDNTQQFRGFLRVVNELGTATDTLFKRIYGSLSRRRKTLVDTEALRRAQSHARALQHRTRIQSQELARLTNVVGMIQEGVIMQDNQGRIVLMNEAAKNLLGSINSFWESQLGSMFREYNTAAIQPETSGVEPLGESQSVELESGTVGVRLARVFSNRGNVLGTVMILSNLQMPPSALSDRLKTSFITAMTHELRTPLTSIKGMSDVLLSMPEGRPPNRRFLEAIGRNVAILDTMIVELLDLSEIEADTFEVRMDPLRLDEEVFAVVKGMEPRLQKARLRITVMVVRTENLNIHGDERRLQWALGHLLRNAIQYTEPEGDIVVQVGRRRNNDVLLKVIDSGVGISEKDLPYIFQRHTRGEARGREGKVIDPRGLGQGLYIARAVVEAHGGQIEVASAVHEGSTFTISLPISDLP
jgi:signal transduction histidine kinase